MSETIEIEWMDGRENHYHHIDETRVVDGVLYMEWTQPIELGTRLVAAIPLVNVRQWTGGQT